MKTAINATEDTPVTQPALRMGVLIFIFGILTKHATILNNGSKGSIDIYL